MKSSKEQKDDAVAGFAVTVIAAGTGFILIGASIPVALIGDATFGSISRHNWVPHEAALRKKLIAYDFAQHLTNSLQTILADTHSSSTNVAGPEPVCTNLMVRLEVCRIGLVPTGWIGWDYALEVEVQLSIMDVVTHQVIWSHGFESCNKELGRESVPYITRCISKEPMHGLSAYKGEPGLNLLNTELEAASARLSRAIDVCLENAGFQMAVVPGIAAESTPPPVSPPESPINTNQPPPAQTNAEPK